jgi:branched-chain amino acid transport system substrate-binding protein
MGGEQREAHFWEVNALTGQSASYGIRSVHGIELAAKHVNDAGGFQDDCGNTYTVKLTVHDMANNREQAISGLRKAADDPTVIVSLGSTPSTGFVPMVPVAGQVKLPIIGTGTAAPISEWNPYAFRVTVTTQAAVPPFMETMVARFDDFKRIALIYDITQDAQRAEAELVRDLADTYGYEIVSFEAFRAGDKDFRSQLTSMRGDDPDWVGIYGATPEGTAIYNQMDELGMLDELETFVGFGRLRKAADDPTVIVSLGSTPSTGFVPMVPVAGQVKLPIIGTGTAAPISEWNPYAFRVTVTTKAAVPQFMATMVERFDSFKKVALIYDITQDANRAEAELIRDLAGEIGYEIVAFEAFRGGDKDFRAQLTAIRGTDPGWVGIYGAAPEGTAIINQMSEMGFLEEVEFFTGFGSFNGANWWDLTDGKVKGGVNWAVGFDLGSEDSLMKQVVADYGTNFEEDIDIYSVYGYQAFQAAVDAVKRACTATDREAFRDALATTNIQALGGNVILDSPRDNPLGENRSGAIIVNRTTGREATEFEVIPLAK